MDFNVWSEDYQTNFLEIMEKKPFEALRQYVIRNVSHSLFSRGFSLFMITLEIIQFVLRKDEINKSYQIKVSI